MYWKDYLCSMKSTRIKFKPYNQHQLMAFPPTFDELISSDHPVRVVNPVLTSIISLGAILKVTYLSYGMAGLPMFLIKGKKSLEAENDEI